MAFSEKGTKDYEVAKRIHDEADSIVKEAQADIDIHSHKKGAEFAEKEAKVKEQQKSREKTSEKTARLTPKKFNEFKKTLEDYANKPTKENTAKIAEQLDVKPETVKGATEQAKEEGRKFAEKVKEEINKGYEEKGEQIKDKNSAWFSRKMRKDAVDFWNHLKKGEYKELIHNQLGRAFVQTAALNAIAEVLGHFTGSKKLPYSTIVYAALDRKPYRRLFQGIASLIKFVYQTEHQANLIKKYNEHLRAGRLNEANKLNLTTSQKNKAKEKRLK
jgi:hypothetical protein